MNTPGTVPRGGVHEIEENKSAARTPVVGRLFVPALRGRLGDWVFYAASFRLSDVAQRVELAEIVHGRDKPLNELIQRTIEKRAIEIGDYLIQHPKEHFFNSLVVGVYEGDPEWHAVTLQENPIVALASIPEYGHEALGVLTLTGEERLFALDGQHRVVGIRDALARDPSLGEEQVVALLVPHYNTPEGLQRTRRLFTTLNRYAKPVNKSDLIALDEDDISAIVTRTLVLTHPLFSERTATKGSKSIARTDKRSVTTIRALYDATDSILRAMSDKDRKKWSAFKKKRPSDLDIAEFSQEAGSYWTALASAFPALRKVVENKDDAVAEGRDPVTGGDLMLRPIGIMVMADVVAQLRRDGDLVSEAVNKVAQVPTLLNAPPWIGLLWDATGRRMITRSEVRLAATQIIYYLVGGELASLGTTRESLEANVEGLSNRSIDLQMLKTQNLKLPRKKARPKHQ